MAAPALATTRERRCSVSIWLLLLSNVLVFQLSSFRHLVISSCDWLSVIKMRSLEGNPSSQENSTISSRSILDYPKGTAVALPSIQVSEDENRAIDRKIYGGAMDKKHLGGFTTIDLHGVSPAVWKHMVSYFGIKSMLDVGCGRGISTSWFALHGVNAMCVEGSHDAVTQTMLPSPSKQVVEHDFSRGPWWPPHTVDAVWSVELLEHIGRNFHHNYLPAFRKAALLFVTYSQWGGWHHVEVHDEQWWISKFTAYGFVYSPRLTDMVRKVAIDEKHKNIPSVTGQPYNAQHLWTKLTVFINPAVAALPEHAHLFGEHGCYKDRNESGIIHRECGVGKGGELESRLPESWYPITMTDDMDKAWEDLVKMNINSTTPS